MNQQGVASVLDACTIAANEPSTPPGLSPTYIAVVVVGVIFVIIIGLAAYYFFVFRKTPAAPKLSPQRISEWGAATRSEKQDIPTLNPLTSLVVGDLVALKDLVDAPELNGKQGKILGIDSYNARLSVSLQNDPSFVISVKFSNVVISPPQFEQPPPQIFTSPDGKLYTYNPITGETSWLSSAPLPGTTSIQ